MGQLTNLFVSESYQGLLKLEDSTTGVTGNLQYVTDGLGNRIPMLASTSSIVITGSFSGDGSGLTGLTIDSGSLVTTSSFNAYTSSNDSRVDALELETGSLENLINQKLDTGSFNSYTSSNDAIVNDLVSATGSYATTSSLTALSQSIAVTDLAQDGRLTSIEGITGSLATTSSLTSLSQSIAVTDLAQDGRLGSLESATGSLQNQINQKLDTGSFNTYSGDTLNLINQKLDSSSFNSYTSSNDTKVNDLISKTGSYATTGSNVFNGTQTISGSLNVTGEITALSASITYLETIFQTSSIIFSSGSNILGDEASDVQTLNGRVDIPLGNLNVTGATTSSLGFFGNLEGTASYATNALSSSHSVNADTASYVLNAVSSSYSDFAVSSSQAQNAVSASHSISSDNAISASQAQNSVSSSYSVNSDIAISSSFAQNAISSSHSINSDNSISSSFAQTAISSSHSVNSDTAISSSFATNALSASYAPQDPLPSGLVSGSAQISYTGITDVPSGIVSSSAQVSYTGITDVPMGIVSGSGQIDDLGYATTSSVNQKLDTGSFNAYTSSNDAKVNDLISQTGSYVTEIESGSFMITGSVAGDTLTFTKGDGSQFNLQVSVATGSLPSGVVSGSQQIIDLGFATTGSNTFIGDQTITGSLNVSGRSSLNGPLSSTDSLIKLFSTASFGGAVQPGQFITTLAPVSQSNIVFATPVAVTGQGPISVFNTGSIEISGSNNILFQSNRQVLPGGAGNTGYLNNSNIANVYPTLNTSSVYRPNVSNNLLYGALNMTMGSGTGNFTIANNSIYGSLTLNVPSASLGGTYANNVIAGAVTVQQPVVVTGSTAHSVQQNVINGTVNIQINSGSFQSVNNSINGVVQITGSYLSTGATISNLVNFNANTINGINHRFLFGGVGNGTKQFRDNLIGGTLFTGSIVANNNEGIGSFMAFGRGLYAEGGLPGGADTAGSTFLGRWNETGSLSNPGQYRFVIGNGTSATNRLTSLALEGATNTFTFNSNTIMTGSIAPLDVKGTILTKRIHFDGNPFNNDPASNLGAIRMDGFNRSLQYTNYDKAEISSQSFIDQLVDTGSSFISTTLGAAYAGTVTRIEAINQNGTRNVNVVTDTMTVTGSLNVTGSAIITGSVQGNVNNLTVASNTASLDLNNGNFFVLALTGSQDIRIEPSSIKPGQTVNIKLNTTGSGTVSFPSSVKQISGSAYVPSTGTTTDIITLVSFDSSDLFLANVKNLI